MVTIVKYQVRNFKKYLKVEMDDVVMFDMSFECDEDLHKVAEELSLMFSVRFNKQVEVVDDLKV